MQDAERGAGAKTASAAKSARVVTQGSAMQAGMVDDDEGVDASFAGRGGGQGTRDTGCSGCHPMQQRARR